MAETPVDDQPKHSTTRAWDRSARLGTRFGGYDSTQARRSYAKIHAALLDAGESAGFRPTRLLDVGCGSGQLLLEAARRYPEVKLAGVDLSPNMLELASGKFPAGQADLRLDSSEALPFADGSFDMVVSTVSMHHWGRDQVALGEIHRVLEPNGVFLLAVPVVRGPLDPRGFFLVVSMWFDLVVRNYRDDELKGKLTRAGFELVTYSTMNWTILRIAIAVTRRPA
jgi:SAM-dependent methyltransferase